MTDAALRPTSIHDLHVQLGARMVPYAGWEMPVEYSGIVSEHLVGVFDRLRGGAMLLRATS